MWSCVSPLTTDMKDNDGPVLPLLWASKWLAMDDVDYSIVLATFGLLFILTEQPILQWLPSSDVAGIQRAALLTFFLPCRPAKPDCHDIVLLVMQWWRSISSSDIVTDDVEHYLTDRFVIRRQWLVIPHCCVPTLLVLPWLIYLIITFCLLCSNASILIIISDIGERNVVANDWWW